MTTLTVAQERERVKAAISFHTQAAIQQIRLVGSELKTFVPLDRELEALRFKVDFRPQGRRSAGLQTFFAIAFSLRVFDDEESPSEIIRLDCVFETEYGLNEGYAPSEEELEAFQEANAVFNAWPFFREFAQNTVTRMGYPAPPIPFLRIVPKPKPVVAKSTESHHPKESSETELSEADSSP